MSEAPPEVPEIPQLTQDQINRLICADWLESIAKQVRLGIVSGFDMAWDTRYNKPVGSVQMSTSSLYGPVELRLKAQIAEEMKKAAQAIPVQDISEQIKDHACDSPECLVCNNSKNEQKS